YSALRHLRHYVALLDPCLVGRAVIGDVLDPGSRRTVRGDRGGVRTELRMLDPAIVDQRIGNVDRLIDRDRETQPDTAALVLLTTAGTDQRVDPDQRTGRIHQRATGITGVDRCVRLDRIECHRG